MTRSRFPRYPPGRMIVETKALTIKRRGPEARPCGIAGRDSGSARAGANDIMAFGGCAVPPAGLNSEADRSPSPRSSQVYSAAAGKSALESTSGRLRYI